MIKVGRYPGTVKKVTAYDESTPYLIWEVEIVDNGEKTVLLYKTYTTPDNIYNVLMACNRLGVETISPESLAGKKGEFLVRNNGQGGFEIGKVY